MNVSEEPNTWPLSKLRRAPVVFNFARRRKIVRAGQKVITDRRQVYFVVILVVPTGLSRCLVQWIANRKMGPTNDPIGRTLWDRGLPSDCPILLRFGLIPHLRPKHPFA